MFLFITDLSGSTDSISVQHFTSMTTSVNVSNLHPSLCTHSIVQKFFSQRACNSSTILFSSFNKKKIFYASKIKLHNHIKTNKQFTPFRSWRVAQARNLINCSVLHSFNIHVNRRPRIAYLFLYLLKIIVMLLQIELRAHIHIQNKLFLRFWK